MANEEGTSAEAEAPTTAPASPPEQPAKEAAVESGAAAPAAVEEVATVIGIDVGAFSSVVCSASTRTLASHILRNNMSGQSTSSMVAVLSNEFASEGEKVKITEKRLLGESAAQAITSNYKVTASAVMANVEEQSGEDAADVKARVEHLGALLSHLASFATASGNKEIIAADGGGSSSEPARIECGIVVPDTFSAAAKTRVEDAARVAGIHARSIIDQSSALALVYGTRKSKEMLENNPRVLFVNVGHKYASASLFAFEGKKATRIAVKSERDIAGDAVDAVLFGALSEDAKAKHGINVQGKGAVRLGKQVTKLKKTLSSVPKAGITVENLGMDRDVAFNFTRPQLEELTAGITAKLASLVKSVVEEARGEESEDEFLKSLVVEVLGGGARVPCFEAAIVEALNGKALMHTLDSLSACAKGAAYGVAKLHEPAHLRRPIFDTLCVVDRGVSAFGTCRGDVADDSKAIVLSEDDVAAACALEESHKAHEELVAATLAAKNNIEQYVYEMRAALRGSRPHSELIEKEACEKILDEVDQWQWDEEGGASDFATAAVFESKLADVKKSLEEGSCKAYLAKVEEEKLKEEERLRQAAEQAAKEKEASGESDDHDFRKLKKPERMRKVQINKQEGTELFKDKNYDYAMKRYKRALLHCTKFFDLDEESKKEVKAIEVTLHNNVAMCATKLENWDVVFEHTKHALDIDADCVKAMRAFARRV